jgi:hypothetical protein
MRNSDVLGYLFRGMQTLVGVLKRRAVQGGSMTSIVVHQRATRISPQVPQRRKMRSSSRRKERPAAYAMPFRKVNVTVELPADFPTMSR